MNTAKGLTKVPPIYDVHMQTAKGFPGDVRMETARGGTTIKQQAAFRLWERELLESAEVKRKATVAQLCMKIWKLLQYTSLKLTSVDFLDFYFQSLGYLASRKERRSRFDKDTSRRQLTPAQYGSEFKSYCGRERVILRRRRTKLQVEQFHIIAQVGQGGYGEVFLARKKETGEVCALKKMRKRTLSKMDEVRWLNRCYTASDLIRLDRFDMF
jgi:cell cycle protein kinase DBF2